MGVPGVVRFLWLWRGVLRCLSLPPSGVFALSFFSICFRWFLCRSVFDFLSSIAPVSCAYFPAPVFFLLSFVASPIVFWLSCLYLVVVWFTPVSFFSLGVCLFLCLPTLSPPCVSPLCCLYFRSPGVSFLFFLCRWLRYVLSSLFTLLPFFATVALPCTGSGFPVSLACSVLLPHSLGIIFVVFVFSPPLLTCWAPLHGVPVSVFACRLLWRFFATGRCPIWLLASPSGCVCSLVACFAFLRVFSPGLC